MMDRQQLIETLKGDIEGAQQRSCDWLPLSLEVAKAILQELFTWEYIGSDTVIVSHKRGVSAAAYMIDGKPDARVLIWRQLDDDTELLDALKEMLDDSKVAIDAMVEKVMEVAEGETDVNQRRRSEFTTKDD